MLKIHVSWSVLICQFVRLTHCVAPPATAAIALTNRSVLTVLCSCKLTAAANNSAASVLLNYKTNFQLCQSMFSVGFVRPDARISHSRCRPAMPIDGKNRKRILWLLHSLEHKYTFQPSFPPPPLHFSFHFLSASLHLRLLKRFWWEWTRNKASYQRSIRLGWRSAAATEQWLYPGSLCTVQ